MLKKEYAKAKKNIAPLNEKFAGLLREAEAYASGERELIGYEYLGRSLDRRTRSRRNRWR